MDKDTSRLLDALTTNGNQLDKIIPYAMSAVSADARLLIELLHNRDLILRCLLSHVIFAPFDEAVPNAETSTYTTIGNKKPNAKSQR